MNAIRELQVCLNVANTSLLYQLHISQGYILLYSYVIDFREIWQFDRNGNSDNKRQK